MKAALETGLRLVRFPALIVADDGWIDCFTGEQDISHWTYSAIRKYTRRRVLLYDSSDRAWLVASVFPAASVGGIAKTLACIRNARIAVHIQLELVEKRGVDAVLEMVEAAIDKDDDILTQKYSADDLKLAIRNATNFASLVGILKRMGALA